MATFTTEPKPTGTLAPPPALHSDSTDSAMSAGALKPHPGAIVRIPINLGAHKLLLALHWTPLLLTSCILPLVGWFSLHYATTMKTQYVLSIFTPLFGAVSLYAFFLRTWRLARPGSQYRPLGCEDQSRSSRWTLDYFDWNFALGFAVVCAVIAAGIAEDPSNVRMASLPLSILLLQVCGQMALLLPLRAFGWRVPCRISSYPRGTPARPAVYTIIEDIVAVDGKQGREFREIWQGRWESSPLFRTHLAVMDAIWGISGLCIAALCIGIIYGINNVSVGWAVGMYISRTLILLPLFPYISLPPIFPSQKTYSKIHKKLTPYFYRLGRPLGLGVHNVRNHREMDTAHVAAGKRVGGFSARRHYRGLILFSPLSVSLLLFESEDLFKNSCFSLFYWSTSLISPVERRLRRMNEEREGVGWEPGVGSYVHFCVVLVKLDIKCLRNKIKTFTPNQGKFRFCQTDFVA